MAKKEFLTKKEKEGLKGVFKYILSLPEHPDNPVDGYPVPLILSYKYLSYRDGVEHACNTIVQLIISGSDMGEYLYKRLHEYTRIYETISDTIMTIALTMKKDMCRHPHSSIYPSDADFFIFGTKRWQDNLMKFYEDNKDIEIPASQDICNIYNEIVLGLKTESYDDEQIHDALTEFAQCLDDDLNNNTKNSKGGKEMNICNLTIIGVYATPEKKLTVVKFSDGDVVKVQCDEEDTFDVHVGVSLAITRKMFGTNTKFRSFVDNVTQTMKKKEKK